MNHGWKRKIIDGGLYGLLACLIYAVVELVATCASQLSLNYHSELAPWQWGLIGILFVAYAVGGFTLGAVGNTFVGKHCSQGPTITSLLVLILSFIVNLGFSWSPALAESLALVVSCLLLVGFLAALRSPEWLDRTAFVSNPWMVSLLLVAVPWAASALPASSNVLLKVCASIVVFVVIAVAGFFARRFQVGGYLSLPQQGVTATAVLAMFVAAALARSPSSSVHVRDPAHPTAPNHFNILLISMDTVRADHLSVYGYERETTPNLQQFAREATTYSRALAVSDYTLPAHASIFTGLYPGWHGAFATAASPQGRPLSQQFTTLAEALRSHGYQTAAAVANLANLQPSLGLDQGFSSYSSQRLVLISAGSRKFYLREGILRILNKAIDTRGFALRTLRAEDINRHALSLLSGLAPGRPFFVFLNYMDAHFPYAPPAPFNTKFTGDNSGLAHSSNPQRNSGSGGDGSTETDRSMAQYDGSIAYEDSAIGQLLNHMRQAGLYDNTLIIITSDHGEAFGEHGFSKHGLGFVYQNQLHVPLLIKYPKQHGPRRTDILTSQVDLMPTILDLAKIDPPQGLQGRSLMQSPDASVAIFASAVSPKYSSSDPRLRGSRQAILAGDMCLISWTGGSSEMYDLAADPGEQHNLYRSNDARSRSLADRLMTWQSSAPRQRYDPGKLDPASLERLKSLGYAQ